MIISASALGAVAAGACKGNDGGLDPRCADLCPPGTRIVSTQGAEMTYEDDVVVHTSECTALCEAIEPCIAPNVPIVTASSYECSTLPGYGAVPPPSEIDTSWGSLWTENPPAEVYNFPTLTLGEWFVGDRDADGNDELLVIRPGAGTDIVWLLSDDEGALTLDVDRTWAGLGNPTLGDVTGDDIPDLVGIGESSPGQPAIGVAAGSSDGSFADPVWTDLGSYSPSPTGPDFTVADVDGDGSRDLLWKAGGLYLSLNDGNGALTAPGLPTSGDGEVIQTGDFDGDGDLDVWLPGNSSTNQNQIVLYDGNGSWGASARLDELWTTQPGAVDLDGDGQSELVVTVGATVPGAPDCGGAVCIVSYRYDGNAIVQVDTWPVMQGGGGAIPLRVDLESDGDEDLVWPDAAQVTLGRNSGGTLGLEARLFPDQMANARPLMADLDGDGRLEAVGLDLGETGIDVKVIFP